MGPKYSFCGNGHEIYVEYGELCRVCLFLGALDYIDLLMYARCITIVGENLGGEVENIECVEIFAT